MVLKCKFHHSNLVFVPLLEAGEETLFCVSVHTNHLGTHMDQEQSRIYRHVAEGLNDIMIVFANWFASGGWCMGPPAYQDGSERRTSSLEWNAIPLQGTGDPAGNSSIN